MNKITRSKITYFFKYQLTKPVRCIYNAFLFIKYPFLQPRNVWTGKKYWDFNKLENIPAGWRKAFGKQLRNDLRKALIKDGILHDFHFTQIKEKYGELCLYNNSTGEATEYVIRHYEELSKCYCINCGKPVRYMTTGWIMYLCGECFDKCHNTEMENYQGYKLSHRLTKDDISHWVRHENGVTTQLDYGVDFEKLWGLEEK